MSLRLRRAALAAATLFLFLSAPALAAEAGGERLETTGLGWFFRWANFAIIAGGLGYLLVKKAPAAFRRHAEAIVASITEAGQGKAEAERRLWQAEEKIARLEQEVAELRAAAQRDAAAEAERIRRAAAAEAQTIARAARAETGAAERAARIELKALAARLAIERAETLLYREITPETQAALVRSFVASLARSAN